uniref:type IV secretion system protein n=1 Tax=Pseudomonas syringae TaxID=317 RepID=UPI001E5409BD|nr:type IV secretion system protein [Pseudomonas syringae]QOQ33609.1 hypothetical protein [Pseudomonas syringae pv. actinidiae]
MFSYLLHAQLLVASIALICGTLIVLRKRRLKRMAVEDSQPVAVPLYAKDEATDTFVVVGYSSAGAVSGEAVRKPSSWSNPSRGQKIARLLVFMILLGSVFLSPVLFMGQAEAGLSQEMKGIFNNELRDFVDSMMSASDGPVHDFTRIMFLAGSVILFAIEITKFIFMGTRAAESNAQAVLWWFATLAIMESYNPATSAIWNVAVGIANGYQEHLVGNTDNFFLAQWIHKAKGAVNVDEMTIFDTAKLYIYYVSWMVTGSFLDLVASLAAMWADFGYALSKVIGPIFIPFLLLPATRNLFDGWFKFFIGFGFLLVVLKATMVVAAISIKAIMSSLNVSFAGNGWGDPISYVNVGKDNFYLLSDASCMLAIAALFVLSSFVFASALAGGLGNLSGGLGSAANMAVKKFMK